MSLISLLDSYGKEISNVRKITEELTVVENSAHIKTLIKLLIDRIFRGENLSNREVNNQKHMTNQTIPEEEE